MLCHLSPSSIATSKLPNRKFKSSTHKPYYYVVPVSCNRRASAPPDTELNRIQMPPPRYILHAVRSGLSVRSRRNPITNRPYHPRCSVVRHRLLGPVRNPITQTH
ncbi:hypothetical protein BOTBODRAFT_411108 [Botryobasidium botryosum FD-172 SS1]|uniref:Uncharacterized protein n=1 Tax=Botryobasidium botryosum (strain FD-172 SS1) TaxID=930990 RepID=A0A067MAQ6_BOTB1|nr:hypothetical protein BOTBODRAFT_411108 [Botryobasidium botryosum FD-172 SS1]